MLTPRHHGRLPARLNLVARSSIIAAAALSALVFATTASAVDGSHLDTGRGLAIAFLPAATASRTLHVEEFGSPDRKLQCAIEGLPPAALCSSAGTPDERGIVKPDGTVSVCHKVPVRGGCCPATVGCIIDYFATSVPILHYGQTTEYGGFRCTSAANGITCVVVVGPGEGKGFRINTRESVVVSGSTANNAPATLSPTFGHTATVKTVSGTVLIEQPGSGAFVPLSTATSVPLGTTIDTTNGTVQLTSARSPKGGTETGQFYSGIFKLTQTKARSQLRGNRSVGITVLSLTGGLPTGCAASASRAATATNRTARRLWGNAHGNFRTAGRYASATVRGTKWLTEDTCGGTVIKVARGIVSVTDLRTHKTVLVHAGGSFRASSSPATATSARLWTALAGKVECGPTGNAPGLHELLCFSRSVPAPPPLPGCVGRPEAPECNVGDPGFAYLHPTGNPGLARPSQLLWYPNARPVTLSSGQTWSNRTLGITCSIGATAVRCVNTSRHGFTITNSSYSAF
jgi:hypothetical protein